VTSYVISIGYNSGRVDDSWENLKATAIKICNAPGRIVSEAIRINPEMPQSHSSLLHEFAEPFKERQDLTIKAYDESETVYLIASGGNVERDVKEILRRAFCRLLIEDMHRQGVEVNLHVS
jgi:hypothetical protein